MKTEIWVSFNYGGWSLIFKKLFDLPFIPFFGMSIFDQVGDYENQIDCITNDYCETTIQYLSKEKSFVVYIRNVWKSPVRDDVVDDEIKTFANTKWKRMDTINVNDLKELMNKDAKRQYSRTHE